MFTPWSNAIPNPTDPLLYWLGVLFRQIPRLSILEANSG